MKIPRIVKWLLFIGELTHRFAHWINEMTLWFVPMRRKVHYLEIGHLTTWYTFDTTKRDFYILARSNAMYKTMFDIATLSSSPLMLDWEPNIVLEEENGSSNIQYNLSSFELSCITHTKMSKDGCWLL